VLGAGKQTMRRREFMVGLGGAAAWPRAARAQQPSMPVIGVLGASPALVSERRMLAFHHGLSENGYVQTQNVAISYLQAEGQYDRLAGLAADLVRRQVNVIVVPGSAAGTLAAKAATTTIPIVFSVTTDPVKLGLVASLARPGGNLTGVNFFLTELGAKRLGLLRELIPRARTVAVLANPTNPVTELGLQDVQAAAHAAQLQIRVLKASNVDEIDMAFGSIARERPEALLVINDPFLSSRRTQIVLLATRYTLPGIYSNREYAEAGGLMSYSTSFSEVYHQLATYTGRILKGAKPADLPVVQSTKFELIINLQAARALSLEVPPILLALADEVIE
jgi:putative ABC transport system substrate-binding protein